MTCENRLCIYWSKDSCTLREVQLDSMGSCTDCIPVSLPEELLARKRKEVLDELERQEAQWRN